MNCALATPGACDLEPSEASVFSGRPINTEDGLTNSKEKQFSLRSVEWLNFFLADVQTGLGPFLAAYLGHESLLGTEKYLTTDYTVYESSQKRMNESIGGLFPEVAFE